MKFERGLDPKKSMNIGVKIYRCGNCGSFISEDGSSLSKEEFKKIKDKVKSFFIKQ